MKKFLSIVVTLMQFVHDSVTGESSNESKKMRGRFGPLFWIVENVLGLDPAKLEVHVFGVVPKLLKDSGWRKTVLTTTLSMLLDHASCTFHLNNQTDWSALHHPDWKHGTDAAMRRCFVPNKSKGFKVFEKIYKRVSAAMLADAQYWMNEKTFKSLDVRVLTAEDLEKIYLVKHGGNKAAARHSLRTFMSSYDGVGLLVGKRAMRKLTKRLNWGAGQSLPCSRLFLKGDGINKGDALYVPWLAHDIVILDWNTTREILPTFTLWRVTGTEEVQKVVRTDWQSNVFFKGLRLWFPLIVKKYYQALKDAVSSFESLVRTLEDSKIESVGPDFVEDALEDQEFLDEVRNLVQALPLLGEDMALAFKGCASKIVRLFGGGNSVRRQISNYSCPYPKGWAARASIKPDISGLDKHGVLHLDKCVLKPGQIYCGQLRDGEEIFGFRWPIGSRKSHLFATNRAHRFYKNAAPSTVFFNLVDDAAWMAALDGGDKDDHLTMIRHKPIIDDVREGLKAPHQLEDTPPDLEFLKKNSIVFDIPNIPLTWENALAARRKKFEEGDVVTVGFYASMSARFMVFGEHMDLFEEGLAGKKYFPQTAFQTEDEASRLFPHQKSRFMPLDGFGKEPFMVWYYNPATEQQEKLPLRDVIGWFKENIPYIRILGLSSKDNIEDSEGNPIIYAELLIDLANMKGDKWFNGKPCPNVLLIEKKILDVFVEGLPGPKAPVFRGGIKTYLPDFDDPLYGRCGDANIFYSGKWAKASGANDYRAECLVPRQWFSGIVANGEFVRIKKTPRDITAAILPAGWHFDHSLRSGSADLIKQQVMQMQLLKEKNKLTNVFRGIVALGIEENERYYEQPMVYDWDENDRYHYFSQYKQWLDENEATPEIAEREFAYTEGALSIARRYDAEILNLLWHKWQEHGGKRPILKKKATQADKKLAAKIMYQRWLGGLQAAVYSTGNGDKKIEKTLFTLLVEKYGDPMQWVKDPLKAPFADLIDWSDAAALTEEFLGHFCKWAKAEVELA